MVAHLYIFNKIPHAKVIKAHFSFFGWRVGLVWGRFGQKVGVGLGEYMVGFRKKNGAFWASAKSVLEANCNGKSGSLGTNIGS